MELRCDNIQYSIEGSRILNGISLGVSNNEFHTILGPNGCGKTTFLKTVYRITKPDLGAIYLDGMLMYGREAQSKTKTASPATIPKSGERNRKIHSCMLYLISI